MYGISVIMLIITLQDGKVMWYEALILVLAYMIYIAGKIKLSKNKLRKNVSRFYKNKLIKSYLPVYYSYVLEWDNVT